MSMRRGSEEEVKWGGELPLAPCCWCWKICRQCMKSWDKKDGKRPSRSCFFFFL